MKSDATALFGALQKKAGAAAIKPLITRETASASDIFYNLKPLFWALSYGADVEVLRALLDADPEAAKEKHPIEGWTPLHYAEKISVESVRLLLARCPEATRQADRDGALPLHWAVEHNAPKEVVQLLLEANKDAALRCDAFGRLPAKLALDFGASEEVVQLLRTAAPAAFRHVPDPPQEVEPVGLLFPGQGSEYLGMLEKTKKDAGLQDMLREAQKLLGFDLLQVCVAGPEKDLKEDLTRAHAAVFIGGLTAHQKLLDQKPQANNFQAAAGFSVGEYAALTAAGVFSFTDGLSLVLEHAKALQDAIKLQDQATTSVMGLEESKVRELCRRAVDEAGSHEVCEISAFLHRRGFLVGGTKRASASFEKLAKASKALQVSVLQGHGAFHTQLMKPAQEGFKVKLQEFLPRTSRPRCKVYMNATGKPIDWGTKPEAILQSLSEQMTLPVRWKDSMESMTNGLEDIFECGPGKQLKAVMKRIDNDTWSRTSNIEV